MSQLKILAFTTMYIYIFVVAINERNIIAAILIMFLCFLYIKTNKIIETYNKNLSSNLSKQREAFISSLSHDLRIPIIAQIRALELILNEKMGNLKNNQKEILIQIEDSCKCILNLMSLMINTYNLENNAYKLIYEKFNISEVVISCFDELLPKAAEKNITFEYGGVNKNLNITADKEELKKVILNILMDSMSNAYTGEKVSVTLSTKNNKIRLTFTCDNKNLYFFTNEYNTHYTSIGQSIRLGFCKKIIENHHGKIINNNKNAFSFEIPQYAIS